MKNILHALSTVSDPRRGNRLTYPIDYLLLVCFSALLSGFTTWKDFEMYAILYESSLKDFYERHFSKHLRSYTPSQDTFGYVFRMLNPDEFIGVFKTWVLELYEIKDQHIAIDGKSMRGVKKIDPDAEGHVVTAYLPSLKLSLDQVFISKKSNEINAIKELFKLIEINDSIITIDAIGTQRDLAKEITDRGADYIFNVKKNQGGTLFEIEELFSKRYEKDILKKQDVDMGHGRVETRIIETIQDPLKYTDRELYMSIDKWSRLASVHKLTRIRFDKKSGEETTFIHYYISSLSDQEKVARLIRQHWSIENNLHYSLDVFFDEDKSTRCKENGPKNVNIMYKIVLFVLERLRVKTGLTFRALKQLMAAKGPQIALDPTIL